MSVFLGILLFVRWVAPRCMAWPGLWDHFGGVSHDPPLVVQRYLYGLTLMWKCNLEC